MESVSQVEAEPAQAIFPINAKFRARLPQLIEDLCSASMVFKPALQEASIYVNELIDYLDFEIQKTDLQIATMEWQSQCDAQDLKCRKEWLAKLKKLRARFKPTSVLHSSNVIDKLVEEVNEVLI